MVRYFEQFEEFVELLSFLAIDLFEEYSQLIARTRDFHWYEIDFVDFHQDEKSVDLASSEEQDSDESAVLHWIPFECNH